MKAKMITAEEIFSRVSRAAVMRTILMMMLMRREKEGYGTVRMNRFVQDISEYADEFLSYREGDIADEKLIQRLEKAGVPVDQQIKNELLSAEREAFRQITGQNQRGTRK